MTNISGTNYLKQGLRYSLIALMLTLAIACSKKSQDDAEGGTGGEGATPDTSITDQALTFDPQGSDSGRIGGLETVYFDYDQAVLSQEARRALENNANWIKSNTQYNIQVEGHTDERGSIEYNLALGERRARAVKAYLVSLGVAADRVSIISYGEEKPLVQGDSEDAYSRNRRANFLPLAR